MTRRVTKERKSAQSPTVAPWTQPQRPAEPLARNVEIDPERKGPQPLPTRGVSAPWTQPRRPAETPVATSDDEPERRERRGRGDQPDGDRESGPVVEPDRRHGSVPTGGRGFRPRIPRDGREAAPAPQHPNRPRPEPPVYDPYDPYYPHQPYTPFCDALPPAAFVGYFEPGYGVGTYVEYIEVDAYPVVDYPPPVPNAYLMVQNSLGILALATTALNTWAMVSDNSHPAASFSGIVIGTSAVLSAAPGDRPNSFATSMGILAIGTGIASLFIGDEAAVYVSAGF